MSFERYYTDGTNVTLTAPQNVDDLTFQKWEVNGEIFTTREVSFLVDGTNYECTAFYTSGPGPEPEQEWIEFLLGESEYMQSSTVDTVYADSTAVYFVGTRYYDGLYRDWVEKRSRDDGSLIWRLEFEDYSSGGGGV